MGLRLGTSDLDSNQSRLEVLPDLMERSGTIQWVEDVGVELDVRDENGNLPVPYAKRCADYVPASRATIGATASIAVAPNVT